MATKLQKPITRLTDIEDGGRQVLVTLEPGDKISFRPQGLRQNRAVSVSLDGVYEIAKGASGVEYTDDEIRAFQRLEAKIMIDPRWTPEQSSALIFSIREKLQLIEDINTDEGGKN